MPTPPAAPPPAQSPQYASPSPSPSPADGAVSRPRSFPHWLTSTFAWGSVVSVAVMSIAGATVRLTGSGLGCSTWPNCYPGSLTPTDAVDTEMFNQFVEFIHRAIAGVVLVAFLGTWLLIALTRPVRRQLMWLAAIGPVGVLFEAVLGGIVVLTELTWWIVGLHLLVSLSLAFVGTLVALRLDEPDGPPRLVVPRPVAVLVDATVGVLAVVVILGVMTTGSGPHAGDASLLFERLPIPMYQLAVWHAGWMHLYLGLLIAVVVAVFALQAPRRLRISVSMLVGLTVAQGALGLTQYALNVPEVLVMFHVFGAVVLVVAAAVVTMATRVREPAPIARR